MKRYKVLLQITATYVVKIDAHDEEEAMENAASDVEVELGDFEDVLDVCAYSAEEVLEDE